MLNPVQEQKYSNAPSAPRYLNGKMFVVDIFKLTQEKNHFNALSVPRSLNKNLVVINIFKLNIFTLEKNLTNANSALRRLIQSSNVIDIFKLTQVKNHFNVIFVAKNFVENKIARNMKSDAKVHKYQLKQKFNNHLILRRQIWTHTS